MSAFSEFLIRKSLAIFGQLDPSEMTEIVTELLPRGLDMHLAVETVEETSFLVEID